VQKAKSMSNYWHTLALNILENNNWVLKPN